MFLAWLFVSWALPDAYGAVDPVDIGVYADQQPTWRRRVAGSQVALPFVSPYDEQEGSGDPITRARLRIVAGVGSPLDTYPADVVAWAKYVFIGNYDDEENGVFQTLNDQRLGVFDTETNTFCEIVVDSEANTSVYRLGVGDPTSRQTRIYFGGFHNMNGVEGSQFGYIEASLDTPNALNPCDPQTGWPVTKWKGQDLNCFRGGQPPGCVNDGIVDPNERPCPNGGCGLDGLAVLDPTTVVLSNWLSGERHIVVRVDAAGLVTVPDVRATGPWRPPNNGSICYKARPVSNPVPDKTSTPMDLRFVQASDATCNVPDGTSGCASWQPICPLDPAPGTCPPDTQQCSVAYCQGGLTPCPDDAFCNAFGIGPCVRTCTTVHPGIKCSNNGAVCATTANCTPPGKCRCAPPGRPMQEYRFNGAQISATSPFFQVAAGDGGFPMGPYDSQGNLWVSSMDAANPIGIYKTNVAGEHAFYDPMNATGSIIVAPEQTMPFSGFFVGYTWPRGIQLGNSIYMGGRTSVQRAVAGFGTWFKDSAYKVALGAGTLPAEAKRCSDSEDPCSADTDCSPGGVCHHMACETGVFGAPPTGPCSATQSCPAGQTCADQAGIANIPMGYGGSPPSLWAMVGFLHPVPYEAFTDHRQYPKQEYLERVPVATPVPDAVVTGRPSIAWTGGNCASHARQCRLWMAALKDGAMKWRVRDDGTWSGWAALPTAGLPTNVTLVGAPAIIADPTRVAVFARGTNGRVYVSYSTSAVTCGVGLDCAFGNWGALYPLPTGVTATADLAATYTPDNTYVAVRGSDEKIYYTHVFFGPVFYPWVRADGLVSDLAPSVAYHATDGKVSIAAKEKTSGVIKRTRVTLNSYEAWTQIGSIAYPAATGAWTKPPAIVSDGSWLHVFVPQQAGPQKMWQVVHDGTGWGGWRPLISIGGATVQAAVANVNGVTNLVSYWWFGSDAFMNEQAVD